MQHRGRSSSAATSTASASCARWPRAASRPRSSCTKPYDIAHCSRWVASQRLGSSTSRSGRTCALLESRAREWSRLGRCFPTNDEALAALAHAPRATRADLPGRRAAVEVARQLLDKYAAARRGTRGRRRRRRTATDRRSKRLPRCADLRFPVLVKPVVGYRFFARFGCKLFVARDRAELRRCDRAARGGAASPARSSTSFPAPTARSTRTAPTSTRAASHAAASRCASCARARRSSASRASPRSSRRSRSCARRRSRCCDGSAFAASRVAEFKRDPRDGRFRFLEVNGRSVLYNALLRQAGLDLAALAWSDHVRRAARVGPPERLARRVDQPARRRAVLAALAAPTTASRFADFLAPYRRAEDRSGVVGARSVARSSRSGRAPRGAGAAAAWKGTIVSASADRTRPLSTT